MNARPYPIAGALTVLGACLLPGVASAVDTDPFLGKWRNASNSMHVQTYACGSSLCGRVVWANEKQQANARKAGTANLIGKELFNNFPLQGDARQGQVFVPRQGRSFASTISVIDANTIQIRGCTAGGLLCRSQKWIRVADAS